MTRACPRCGEVHERHHAYCANCTAAYMRNWRAGRPLTGEARRRDIARSKAGVYLKRGKIIRSPCEARGEPAEMHHHRGYEGSAALDVQWLCRKHHLEVHETSDPKGTP